MLHNSEGATLTDHMHEICFYYGKKTHRKTELKQISLGKADKNIILCFLLISLCYYIYSIICKFKKYFFN